MGISRRKLLMGGGVAALAVAVPVGQHVVWNGKSFSRDGFDDPLPEIPAGEQSWSNWSGIQHATPKQIAAPGSEAELADLIRNGTGRVRPVGTGHSFTGLVPSEGTIVDVSRFGGLISHDIGAMTATFGAGTRLRQASRLLSELGLAFPNMPDIDVQTLAGSFATATHGAGANLAAIHDYTVGFRLVTAAGDVMDITEQSHPDIFAAGKVSLGALGVITQYTLKVVPAFKLKRTVLVTPIEEIIANSDAKAAAHRGYEFFYFPGTGYGAELAHDLTDDDVTPPPPSLDDETLEQLKEARDKLGWWPWMRRKLVSDGLPKGVVEERVDESWRLLSTARPTRFNEMEFHLPRETGISVLREVVRMMDRRKDAFFPIEVRYVAPDDAWLSPFNNGEGCLSIAIHALHDERFDYFFKEFEPMYLANGGRPHWGKLHTRTDLDFDSLYPDFNKFKALRRQIDPNGKFLNPHLAELFGETFSA